MVAIMLYMEMPVAVFEAQRQKEQLLIDRGGEYAHAVKLFVRKLGTYPASMEALEQTNQIRFLRHRFKDPFTGKEDWRVLHAGPNGMLIDSKVKPAGIGQNGTGSNGTGAQNGSGASSAAFGSTSNNASPGNTGFGNSSFGSGGSDSSSTSAEVVVPPLSQRAPAVAANGSGSPVASAADQNPLAPLLPPGQAEASTAGQEGANGLGSTTGMSGQNGAAQAGANPSTGMGNAAGTVGTTGNANGLGQQGTAGNPGTAMGTMTSPGIAGVASIAKGHSIKVVNDQTDYSLWEFYYDPTKDATKGIASAMGAMGAGQTGSQPGAFGQNQQQQNGFGTSSAFGSSSAFGTTNSSGSSNSFGSANGSSSNGSNGSGVTPSSGTVPQAQPQ